MGGMYGFWRELNLDQKAAKDRYNQMIYNLQFRELAKKVPITTNESQQQVSEMMTESQLLKPTEPQQETPLVTPKPASVYTEEPKGPAEGIKQIAKETTESPNQQSTSENLEQLEPAFPLRGLCLLFSSWCFVIFILYILYILTKLFWSSMV
ncbi:sucrose synthase 6-like [Carica papaya]|uniref:sucrose synthase 6-like n=1 Tax=Carica papaya TaxID=3649 RepID=UPI000B8C7FB3|nr:sucrose synthase 6-like [Carica papaya]